MKTCFVYAQDREREARQLLADLAAYSDICLIDPALPRGEQLRVYQECACVGFLLSQGLKGDHLLSAIVEFAINDAIANKKTIFPIYLTSERGMFIYLEVYKGIFLYCDGGDNAHKQHMISLQLQKLARFLKEE